jgi:hypothetical protein
MVLLLETYRVRATSEVASKEANNPEASKAEDNVVVVIGPLVEDLTITVPVSLERDSRPGIPPLLATPPTTANSETNKLEALSAGVCFTPLQEKTIPKPSVFPTTKLGLPTSADAVMGTVPKSPISWKSTAKAQPIRTSNSLEPKFTVAETSLSLWSVAR